MNIDHLLVTYRAPTLALSENGCPRLCLYREGTMEEYESSVAVQPAVQ